MFVVYPFVFKKESPQGYFIESVDIKEAYTGINTDDISFGISMAEEVLGLVLSEYVERGIELPKATPIEWGICYINKDRFRKISKRYIFSKKDFINT